MTALAYVSLYRKWRPQTFEEVLGQEYVTRTLANSLRNGNFAHAYLFAGPRGTGKTSTARILAKALNCVEGPTPSPCNRCDSCRAITEGSSVDVVEIDAASNRGIDDVRDLRERVIFTPAASRVKVYILDEAHMITRDAFNAFLKTLEEPPAHVIFVLATTEPHKVPQTILSRCQRHDFRSVPVSVLEEFLEKVAAEEGFTVAGGALHLIARRARGSVRDALVFLEQLASYGDGVLDEASAAAFLGLIEEEMLVRLGECLASGRVRDIISLVEQAYDEGKDLVYFAGQVQEHFRRIFLLQHADLPATDLEVDEATFQEMRKQAAMITPGRVGYMISALQQLQDEMKRSSAPRLVLESSLVAMAREETAATPEALAARLSGLEERVEEVVRRAKEGAAAGAEARADRRAEPAREEGEAREEAAGKRERKHAARGDIAPEVVEARHEPAPRTAAGVDLATVRRAWPHIKEKVKERKVTTHAFLLEGKPVELSGGRLVISFPPDRAFHRGELEKDNHREVLEKALEEVLGARLLVSTSLEEGDEGGGGEDSREALRASAQARRGEAPSGEAPAGEERGEEASGGEAVLAEGTPRPGAADEAAPEAGEAAEVAAPEEGEAAARGDKRDAETHEAGKVKLVKDIFGAEMVEEIKLSE